MAVKKAEKPKSAANFTFLLVVTVIALGIALWFAVKTISSQKQMILENNTTLETLNQEKQTCRNLVSGGKGSFAEYEYCKRLQDKFK